MDNSYINAFRHFLYVLTRRKTEVVFIFLSLRLGNVVINHDMMVSEQSTFLRIINDNHSNHNITKLLPSDLIYSRDWWEKPTVVEEYKLIFFTIPKVACARNGNFFFAE
jgi:hypothetical protein